MMPSNQTSHNATWVPGDFQHPNEHIRRPIQISLVFAFTLSTLAVVLRLVARRLTSSKLFLDDWLILVALLFKYGCSIGTAILLWNGLGSHITMVPKENLETFFKIGWANPFPYTATVVFVKLSILALYKRLFATKKMLTAIYIVGTIVLMWAVAVFVTTGLMCIPVNKFWDPTVEGACIDAAKFYYGIQIPNILTDAILLCMPLNVVWKLPIAKSQKLLLSGVFLVGGLTLVFDIVRLYAMIELTKAGPDITYNQAPVAMWTCTEAAVGIIAACLPNLRPLFKTSGRGFWSQLRSSAHRSGWSGGKSSGNSNSTDSTDSTGNTTSTSDTAVSISTPTKEIDSRVSVQTVDTTQYNDYMKGVKA
ncbi:hypothetical protein N7510_007866 [Penicillium lagena]|uniref:uncharacterized protein n=1 Tax=Penicillium lagena TaxID=94218 RepID=UPI0025411A2D|nr:uncharacterized protein N7510_007866 [Penicillium lagena]KAJ5611147.1 hypothetical protein N7510_007866 [Penicillium lagena]